MGCHAIVVMKLPGRSLFLLWPGFFAAATLPCGSLRVLRAPSFLSLIAICCSCILSISKADAAVRLGATTRWVLQADAASSDSQERLAVAIHLNLSYTVRVTVSGGDKPEALKLWFSPFSGNVPDTRRAKP